MNRKEILKIAEFLHETVRFWSEVNRNFTMKTWSESEEWERDFMVTVVTKISEGSDVRCGDMHTLWVDLQLRHNKGTENGAYIPNKLWSMLSDWQKKKYRIIWKLASELTIKEDPIDL